MNLVVFFTDTPKCEVFLQIVKRIFYRFWKTFFQSDCIFGGKFISAIYNDFGGGAKKFAAAQKKSLAHRKINSVVERPYHFP